ncbi:response regulator SirA [Patescibacteria group bacterium]|nr:response regulator SirA [Patescibacteria group bacterium]
MKLTKIYKRDGSVVPFDQKKIIQALYKAIAEVAQPNMDFAEQISDKVLDILENHFPKTIPTVEEIQDIIERVLVREGHKRVVKAYIIYRQKRKELREKKVRGEVENIPYKTIWQSLVWSLNHQVETIDKLNKYVRDKTLPKLVKAVEDAYEQELTDLCYGIKDRIKEIKLFIICGPSSSGKTTTTERLTKKLEKRGVSFVKLNIDNYFYDTKDNIEDEYGDHDFEGPYALDLPLINQHFEELLKGKTIEVPRYNFETGTRDKKTDKLSKRPEQIILIDSHFGIYPKLTEAVPSNQKYIIYLETLCQLRYKNGQFVRWTDIRMLRRMIRDAQFRAYDPIKTVGHWHYVRQGELKNIIPYIASADHVFNTFLAYELPILKSHIFKFFPKIVKTYQKDSGRQDAYVRAQRVYNLLKQIQTWSDDRIVPKNSILREFIG